jgi:FtsP/CotA-like multicopper oxidase with cupredoxin domain
MYGFRAGYLVVFGVLLIAAAFAEFTGWIENCKPKVDIVNINRRSLLKSAGMLPLMLAAPQIARTVADTTADKADYALRIATGLVELSPEHIVSTTLYNGQFPGPMVRLTEGKRVVVDLYNDTDTPGQLHWHGQFVPVDVDGAAEEGTPYIPAHSMRRISFVPQPSGFRFYPHSRRAHEQPQHGHLHGASRARLYRAGEQSQSGPSRKCAKPVPT